jgi:phosphoenolpyruvate phosphomutase
LFPLTKETPKSLLKVGSSTVLDIEVGHLMDCGIKDIVITTGHQAEKMEKHVLGKYPHASIALVNNEKYDTTNYIYSMWLARSFTDNDTILLHGDTVFERSILRELVTCSFENAVLVNGMIEAPDKDFKADIRDGIVREIGIDAHGGKGCFCAPIYKLSKTVICRWMEQIERFVEAGEVTCYAEDALNQIAHEIELKPLDYGDRFCMEIDTRDDLEQARGHYEHL